MENDKENVAWREAIKEMTLRIANKSIIPLDGDINVSNNVNNSKNLQSIHTPFELCFDIIERLKGYVGCFDNKDFLVFNLEFADVLIYDFGVSKERIWFLTDCVEKVKIGGSSRYNGVNVMEQDFFEMLQVKEGEEGFKGFKGRKFDFVIGNPPYQKPKNVEKSGTIGGDLWSAFVEKGLELCKQNGYLSLIHPPMWRKPEHRIWEKLTQNQIKYLEIHSEEDGRKTFNASTKYDWYILQKSKCED